MKQSGYKKKIFAMIGATVIIALLVIGCTMKKAGKSSTIDDKIANAIEKEWQLTMGEEIPEYLQKLNELATYEITSIQLEEEQYIIDVVVSAPDLGTRLKQVDYIDMPTTDDLGIINDFLCSQIELAECSKTSTILYANEINGEFKVVFTEQFIDAMCGNVYSYSQTVLMEALKEYEGGDK